MAQLAERRIVATSLEETQVAGNEFALTLRPGDVVALRGELGAGKTTFVRGVVEGLGGSSGAVSSPTFAIVHSYESPIAPVHHIDGYRIRSEAELDEMGFDEYFDGESIVLVEWPDRVQTRLPAKLLQVTIEHDDETCRRITISPTGSGRHD
jgi:tRNA threonylcarbamoyladenosine biosynthesis protein TsaE